jgi:methylated-DNA-[protein]-cysteine S-methyltransferase
LIAIATAKRSGVWFSVATNQNGQLVACAFSDKNQREAEKAVRKSLPRKANRASSGNRGDESFRVLSNFYNGRGDTVSSRSIDLSLVSGFRRDVYRVLCRIPLGKVTTYGAIAKKLGGRRYARAVGTAVATNPLPLIVPCHRVVPSSLMIGNYGMCGRNPSAGGYMKRMLLEREGVKFQGELVSKQSIWIPN